MLVPQRALRRDPKGQASVLLVDGGGKVDVRLVDVGRTVGDSWQVLSGLKPGDRVIVEGGQNVRPGMSVKIRAKDSGEVGGAGKGLVVLFVGLWGSGGRL